MSLPIPTSIEHANMDTSSESSSLSGLTLDSGVSTVESIASGGSAPANPPKKRVVKKMDDKEIRFLLESFCEEAKAPNSKFSINKFADCRGVPKATLKGILKASGISVLQLQTESNFVIQQKITNYLAQRQKNETKRHASDRVSFLNEDEQRLLLHYASQLAIFGHGVNKNTLLELCNSIANMNVDRRDKSPCTMSVVDTMIKNHQGLLILVKACSIDPQRAKKATAEVRDHYFMKVENFVKMTNSIGLHDWKSAADVPDRCWYNMDEKGLNVANGFLKVLMPKEINGTKLKDLDAQKAHVQTAEGDGKMNHHITGCFTSKGDGTFFIYFIILLS
jgi:hypothetical protein